MRTTLVLLALALGLPTLAGCSSDEVKPKGDITAPAAQDSGADQGAKPKNEQKVGGRGIPGK
jgi:outer membrane murein-binding lipoprotein Lpp